MLRQPSESVKRRVPAPLNNWTPCAKGRKTPTEHHWPSRLGIGRRANTSPIPGKRPDYGNPTGTISTRGEKSDDDDDDDDDEVVVIKT